MPVEINAWTISAENNDITKKEFLESIFSQANGYMGVRGFCPDGSKVNRFSRTTFIAGFFEYIKNGVTDMVNQPDFSPVEINIGDIAKTSERITLDMRDGSVTWRRRATGCDGRITDIEITRFLSLDDFRLAGVRVKVKPVNYSGTVKISARIDGDVANLPIADDQMIDNNETVEMWGAADVWADGSRGGVSVAAAVSGRKTAAAFRIFTENISNAAFTPELGERSAGVSAEFNVCKGVVYTLEKIVAVYCYRDSPDPKSAAKAALELPESALRFDCLLNNSRKAWEARWRDSDFIIRADAELQGAVRYNIFNLIQNAPATPGVSIGARGLTHGRYKGCYFWDTEIFMAPFFMFTNPAAAKNLLLYRVVTLPAALSEAKKFSLSGARYPWMSSDAGREQCQTWDTGDCEVHITADIAYAFGRYLEITGDDEFFTTAAEVFIQTARYWLSRFTYHKETGVYNLLFVKGPDEYCGVTSNDFYTVKMARHNFLLAIEAVNRMRREFPDDWARLSKKISFDSEEIAKWRDAASRSVMRRDPARDLFIQDDTFEILEPLDIAAYKNDDRPAYQKFSFDRLQRFQALKQPNVLMAVALFPNDFTEAQKLAAWEYYEPKTLHDSSLSFGVHALVAARLGLREKAAEYFRKAVFLDLRDVMGVTAKEGLHMAAFGAAWQALAFGFAGLWADAGETRLDPAPPGEITGAAFSIWHKGSRREIDIDFND